MSWFRFIPPPGPPLEPELSPPVPPLGSAEPPVPPLVAPAGLLLATRLLVPKG